MPTREFNRPPNFDLCNINFCPCPLGHITKDFFFPPPPRNSATSHAHFASRLPSVEEEEILIPPCTDEILYKRRLGLELQSGDIVLNPSLMQGQGHESHTTEETVQFLDENQGQQAGFKYVDGLQHSDFTSNVPLSEFLSRPVRIANFTWNESDLPGPLFTLNPWRAYFDSSYVKPKIQNFGFIRCNLKVKVLINASPFYYGAVLAAYQPVPGITPSTIQPSGGFNYFIPYSQRPHMWLYPANSEGAEMTLPFFWNKNWLQTNNAQQFTDMGILEFIAYTFLQSANGTTGTGVSIQVYAWAEDVELSGPTLGLVMQTDEYGSGVVSAPASAIAAAAGKLRTVPVIGRFATATQIGATAIAKIASVFGFSNPPVIANTTMMRPTAFPQMSNTETCHPHEKLSLDPKNELTVDPAVVGLPSIDNLEIATLVKKESYLTEIAWSTIDAADTMLFSSYVTPQMYGTETASQCRVLYGTPQWWVSKLFNCWRGDIIFRFKFVTSQYHKGRVRISWDPQGTTTSNLFNLPDSSNVVQTAIVDLGKDTDVEFRVPYHQAYPWLLCRNATNAGDVPFSTEPTRTWADQTNFANGCLTVRVQTKLTAPVATSNITMMVFVRGAENLEFANPGQRKIPISTFVPQSGEFAEPTTDTPQVVTPSNDGPPPRERYLVNFGEKVTTLRTLLHRTYLTNVAQIANVTAGSNCFYTSTFFKLPPSYGYDPAGTLLAKGLIAPASNFNFNYTLPNPLDWILSAFAGFRGSTVVTVNVNGFQPLNHIRIVRKPYDSVTQASNTFVATNFVSRSDSSAVAWLNLDSGSGGSCLTNQRTQAGLSAVLPNYTVSKFASPHPSFRNTGSPSTESTWESYALEVFGTTTGPSNQFSDLKVEWYFAGGSDLMPLFFVNVPTYTLYDSVPAP